MTAFASLPGIVQDVFRFRSFVLGSVRRDIAAQYQGALLGGAWVVLQPMAMIAIYTLIFANVMRSRLAGVEDVYGYSIYLCAGVLTWGFFSDGLTRLQGVFVANGNLLKKATFPRICLPLIALGTAAVNFAVIFGLFLFFLLLSGHWPGWVLLALVVPLAVQIMLILGLGMLAATLNVFFRDVGQFFGIFLQFWFWLTPIVYPASILSEGIAGVIDYNPMTSIVTACQGILVNQQWPEWKTLWPVTLLATLLWILGFRLFRRRAGEMVDEL